MPLTLQPPPPHTVPTGDFGTPERIAFFDRVLAFNPLDSSIKVIYTCVSRRVVSIGDGIVVRYSDEDPANAMKAIELVKTRTTVPTAKAFTSFYDAGTSKYCMVMEKVLGERAEEYLEGLTNEEERKEAEIRIAKEAVLHHQELRKLTSTVLGGLAGGPYHCDRLAGRDFVVFKESDTERDFLSQLLAHGKIEADSVRAKAIWAVYERYLADIGTSTPPFVFTHGDLCSANVLVDHSGNLTSVIDFEMSGFFPAWWAPMLALVWPPMGWWRRLEVLSCVPAGD